MKELSFVTTNPKITGTIEQREMSTENIISTIPFYPSWGIKTNSQGKNNYWFGQKAQYAVSTQSQYLLVAIISSAFVSDSSFAIPLMRKLRKLTKENSYIIMDRGYDALPIYEEAHRLDSEPIIANKKAPKNDGEFDANFAPTCVLECSYKYDSFDHRYGALKFIRPETRCRDCPLRHEEGL